MALIRNCVLAAAIACSALAGTASAEPIRLKVGVLNDMSGVYSDTGGPGSVVAARLAIEDFARDSATTGAEVRVELVAADHQNKPDVGAAIARQWYDRDGVDAIFDVPTSSVALAVSQVTREKTRIFIDSGAGTTDLTGKACSPNTIQWTYDTYALAHGTAGAMLKRGGGTWYFLTADYAFGISLQNEATAVVQKGGGRVLGAAKVPFPAADFSSFLLQAQASQAKVVGLANAGGDTINAVKQAHEFGLMDSGQTLAALLIYAVDVHALGLQTARGLVLTESFYWDLNPDTRAFSERFARLHNGSMPTMNQAGVYAGLLHYLKAVAATKSKDAQTTMAWMKANPTDDPLFGKGSVRVDGRKLHPMYLFEVKAPAESKGAWDLYKLLDTIPAEQAFRPLADGGCPLAGKG
ncbi:branched-chain amino acid transport system substrate-binding protein [Methylobacterium brachiatum]|jgi:branched-chain amino acid transport system substrate-binding protein|uniref:Branched-chain amino acid transport system substrate-binding protein n=1 Tax=Methylobacterium brachiatum TaxID=269660 RepID=A0AAJ1WYP6_9HYPH|nr:ABC transporter substrate-binding protein [Methylobacterium brachiatum]MCB4805625.1 ABC transporter substrate-binding protein [Methylobacterium brachiatum]MDQ0546702.1 branched-chain amino acid transport system substrate-binding protein [Methylobacterium brachiatum]